MVAKPKEFKSLAEIQKLEKLPQIMLYSSSDSFEFELLAEKYKNALTHSSGTYEVIVFVSEPGDADRFFSEIFNFSMFATTKLFIIKSAQQFFKPMVSQTKDYLDNMKLKLENIPENYIILIHFEADVPAKIAGLFGSAGLLKSRNYYPNETRDALNEILKNEKITFDQDAFDEFIYKTHPSHGAYTKNLQKLMLYLNKKHYNREDIDSVLFNNTELNASVLVDLIFQNREYEFFKELSKYRSEADKLLLFLTILLNRVNEIRKFRVLSRQSQINEEAIIQMLGMNGFSEKRQRFVLSRMKKESTYFTDRVLDSLYEMLIDLNIRSKVTGDKEEVMMFFSMKMTELFHLMKIR